MKFTYPAVRGTQANHEYYIIMMPIGDLSLISEPSQTSAANNYQRALNKARIPEIRDYVLSNRDSYVFSAITVSMSGNFEFMSTESNNQLGLLIAQDDVVLRLNDGQHRKAALQAALNSDSSLSSESISVVVFIDEGLKRSQQMFTDLNKNAVKSSNSLATLFDSRDALSICTTHTLNEVPILSQIVDVERDILGKNSMYFFSLNTLRKANDKILTTKNTCDEGKDFLVRFWSTVFNNIKEWQDVVNGIITKQFFRDTYILHFNVTLYALARLGNFIFRNNANNFQNDLAKLANIDWAKNNKEDWAKRIFTSTGSLVKGEQAEILICARIKKLLGFELTKQEQRMDSNIIGR